MGTKKKIWVVVFIYVVEKRETKFGNQWNLAKIRHIGKNMRRMQRKSKKELKKAAKASANE